MTLKDTANRLREIANTYAEVAANSTKNAARLRAQADRLDGGIRQGSSVGNLRFARKLSPSELVILNHYPASMAAAELRKEAIVD